MMMTTTFMRLKSLLCICLVLLMGAAACRKGQPPVARPMPPAPPPPVHGHAAARSACADARADAAATAADRRCVGAIARRFEPRLAAAAGLFRSRQLGRQRCRPRDAAGERRGPEEIPDVGRSRSKATATSAERQSTIWLLASDAPSRRARISSRSASTRAGCAR